MKNAIKIPLPDDVAEALCHVLDHFIRDEARDYEAASSECQEGHIFNSLRLVERWLSEHARLQPQTPEETPLGFGARLARWRGVLSATARLRR